MPRKPPKKSPAKRMKPFKAWCIVHKTLGTPDRDVCDGGNTLWPTRFSLLQCVGDDYRPARVIVTELPTPTDSHARDEGRKLRKVKRYCEELKSSFDGTIGARDNPSCVIARDILKMIDTPTARGR